MLEGRTCCSCRVLQYHSKKLVACQDALANQPLPPPEKKEALCVNGDVFLIFLVVVVVVAAAAAEWVFLAMACHCGRAFAGKSAVNDVTCQENPQNTMTPLRCYQLGLAASQTSFSIDMQK